MARLIRATRRTPLSCPFFSPKIQFKHLQSPQIKPLNFPSFFQTRNYISEMRKSTFEGHILRVLRNEIQYETEYAPPKQPVREFGSFTVDDYPGEQCIKLRSKKDGNQDIKIEVTMFDGAVPTKNATSDDDMKLHISLIVNVVKRDNGETFQFVCSAWPDCVEVQKVFFLNSNETPKFPYMGPAFKDLDDELQTSLMEFLEERGVDDDLAAFLHEYMHNKDRTELIRWMGKVKSFVEK